MFFGSKLFVATKHKGEIKQIKKGRKVNIT